MNDCPLDQFLRGSGLKPLVPRLLFKTGKRCETSVARTTPLFGFRFLTRALISRSLDIVIFFTRPSRPFRNVSLILFHFAPAGGWAASVTRRQVLSGLNAVMPAAIWAVFGPRSFS